RKRKTSPSADVTWIAPHASTAAPASARAIPATIRPVSRSRRNATAKTAISTGAIPCTSAPTLALARSRPRFANRKKPIVPVAAGGRFAGALGIVAAIEAVERLPPSRATVAVVAFRDEEGWRFGRGFFGSRAACGLLAPEDLELRNGTEISVADALAGLGLSPERALRSAARPDRGAWRVERRPGARTAERRRALAQLRDG